MRRRLQDMNDNDLLPYLQRGDEGAFEEFYHRYHLSLYQNIYRITKEVTATEDLLQDTFIKFWQQRAAIVPGKSLAGWLFMISYHTSINWLRHQLVENKAKEALSIVTDAIEPAPDYDQLMELLEQALRKLPPQKRKVIELCKLQGQTYKQAARLMNISTHTVKEYLSGAMKFIRDFTISHPEYKILLPFLIIFSTK